MDEQPVAVRLVVDAVGEPLEIRQGFGVPLSGLLRVPPYDLLEIAVLGHDKPPRRHLPDRRGGCQGSGGCREGRGGGEELVAEGGAVVEDGAAVAAGRYYAGVAEDAEVDAEGGGRDA